MADFRRWFTVLAVLALMAGAASAQVGVATGSANSLFACVATAAGTPELRPEGYTELAGDIVISCTGGPDLAVGSVVPTTNITVYMQPSVPITSRYIGSGSEALLIIDDAGSGLTTGAVGNYGPAAAQALCTTAQQQQSGGSACTAYVGKDNAGAGNYEVALSSASGSTNAANVYQGKIGDFGVNSVTFYAVPVLPPATTGVTRTFRITNIRVPLPGTTLNNQLTAIISTSPSTVLPISGTAINIGVVGPAMSAAVKPNTAAFQQCIPQTVARTAQITFTEGFATGFKTRVVPGGALNGGAGITGANALYAGQAQNLASPINQNIPGGLYGGFASNSESGFIFPALNSGTTNYTAGLADYGTRLKAVFYNVPAGLTLYVSTASNGTIPSPVGGTSQLPYALLVGGSSSTEASSDGSAFTPLSSSTAGSDGLFAYPLVANAAGTAYEAVWEVVNSNPSAQDVLTFSVYVSYSAAGTPVPYGSPITDLPLGSPVNDVQLSLAPEPSLGLFSTANASQGQIPTPRFAVVKTQEGRFITIGLCQTTLLYPFVTGAAGFDTGIAVANTSADPFGTVNQAGSCKLYGYGQGATATSTTTVTVPGCDSLANGLAGTNCFDIVYAGQVKSVMASAVLPSFTGYVIAVCNFQYAHGYAAVTDLGLRNLWSSYLALELGSGANFGSPRKNISSIEELIH